MAKISFMVSIIGEAEGTNMIEDTVRHKNILSVGLNKAAWLWLLYHKYHLS